jgi:hypothetical protein
MVHPVASTGARVSPDERIVRRIGSRAHQAARPIPPPAPLRSANRNPVLASPETPRRLKRRRVLATAGRGRVTGLRVARVGARRAACVVPVRASVAATDPRRGGTVVVGTARHRSPRHPSVAAPNPTGPAQSRHSSSPDTFDIDVVSSDGRHQCRRAPESASPGRVSAHPTPHNFKRAAPLVDPTLDSGPVRSHGVVRDGAEVMLLEFG